MKLPATISKPRRAAGVLLIECLVYLAVFGILLGVGTAAFYFCWNYSKALVYAADDVTAALYAGEHWRADIRAATGNISAETNDTGITLRIPEANQEVIYRFESGVVRRETPVANHSLLLLPKVEASQMMPETRDGVTAWRWELKLKSRRPETRLPLLFTFEAVPPKP
jgi:hypothetical protein